MAVLKWIGVAVGLALLAAGGAFAWREWDRARTLGSHRSLTRLEVGLLNDTCEMCHGPESRLYRGKVGVRLARPEWKGPVACTDCHDFVKNEPVSQKCVECHGASYLAFLAEWATGFDDEMGFIARKLRRAESGFAAVPHEGVAMRRAGRLVKEAREGLDLVRRAQAVHHPEAARALLAAAREKAEKALDIVARR